MGATPGKGLGDRSEIRDPECLELLLYARSRFQGPLGVEQRGLGEMLMLWKGNRVT